MALTLAACDCRPLLRSHWVALDIHCNSQSDFASSGADQVILESRDALDNFLRRDCLRGETRIVRPDVDFSSHVVMVDVTQSPMADGTCLKGRQVADVQACVGGCAILYDDVTDPACGRRKLTGAVAVRREDVRAAWANQPARGQAQTF
jgi:hypothetical protein